MYITILIATSPRCSPDQQQMESTEEAHSDHAVQKSSKCYSDIFTDKEGNMCKKHDEDKITLQSAIHFATDCNTKDQLKEFHDYQQTTNVQPLLCSHSIKTATILSNIQYHTKQTVKSKGEEIISCIDYEEVPSEELHDCLETVGQKEKDNNCLQTAPESEEFPSKVLSVQPEQVQNFTKITAVQSKPGNLRQKSNTKPEQNFNSVSISSLQPNKFCKLDKSFKSKHPATVQSEGQCRSSQMTDAQSGKLPDCSVSGNVLSVRSCNSLRTATNESEDLNMPLHKPSVLADRFWDFTSSTSMDLSKTEEIETIQTEHLNFVHWDIYNAAQKGSNVSALLHRSTQEASSPEECLHTKETAQDQEDSSVHCWQKSSTDFAQFYCTKRTSAVQSNEIYLSSSSDSHWSDSVNANKVAVEGDLIG